MKLSSSRKPLPIYSETVFIKLSPSKCCLEIVTYLFSTVKHLLFFLRERSDPIITMLINTLVNGSWNTHMLLRRKLSCNGKMKYPQCWCYFFLPIGNHSQISRVPVAIKVLDVNDNAPEFASEYEAFLCENGKPGQVNISMLLMLNMFVYNCLLFWLTCIIVCICIIYDLQNNRQDTSKWEQRGSIFLSEMLIFFLLVTKLAPAVGQPAVLSTQSQITVLKYLRIWTIIRGGLRVIGPKCYPSNVRKQEKSSSGDQVCFIANIEITHNREAEKPVAGSEFWNL